MSPREAWSRTSLSAVSLICWTSSSTPIWYWWSSKWASLSWMRLNDALPPRRGSGCMAGSFVVRVVGPTILGQTPSRLRLWETPQAASSDTRLSPLRQRPVVAEEAGDALEFIGLQRVEMAFAVAQQVLLD